MKENKKKIIGRKVLRCSKVLKPVYECSNCRLVVDKDDKFCKHCGTDTLQITSNNKQRQLYLELCDELDVILKKSGILKVCYDCFNKKLFKHAVSPNYATGGVNKKTYGCCVGCKYCGANGCTTNSITCKLWLSSNYLVKIIYNAGYETRWKEIVQICKNKGWAFSVGGPHYRFVRMGVDDYPELAEDR